MWVFLVIVIIGVVIYIQMRSKQTIPQINRSSHNDNYTYDIVGEQSYQNNLKAIAGNKKEESKYFQTTAKVLSEPNNKYDKNAIKIEINGLLVGYVPKHEAVLLSGKKINKSVPCVINGGWLDNSSEGSYGVKLAIKNVYDLI